MDAINSYIDHMFRGLPKSDEVSRAQRDCSKCARTATTSCAPRV